MFQASGQCPRCHNRVLLYKLGSGWLGRYGRCPNCQAPLFLAFRKPWAEYLYGFIYPLTMLYAAAAATELCFHFAVPGDRLSHIWWSMVGIFAGFMPGFHINSWMAERFGSVGEGHIRDIFKRDPPRKR